MRKIKEIIRLKLELGLSARQIARSCSISHSTVLDVLRRAEESALSWPFPEHLDDGALEARLYPARNDETAGSRIQPEWSMIHRELKRKGVTLQLLWQEYKQVHPDGYQYSYFCELYRKWSGTLDLPLRQIYRAGEKMFVDYAGMPLKVVDIRTGKIFEAPIFVAVLGASNYTFAEATPSQELEHWIGSHCRCLEYFGGVPEYIVPDNLRSGVTRACRYEPDINPTYQEMAAYYGTAVVPARPRHPRDKAKVETGVQIVERSILAPLRNRTFFSLGEGNMAIREGLEKLNEKPFQKLDGSRRLLYEELEKSALTRLPAKRYEFARWKKARVNIDYHVEVEKNYYSVSYRLVKEQVEVRLTDSTVEILHRGKRVSSHPRLYGKGKYSTIKHRPAAHQKYLEWTPSRIIRWAEQTGVHTAKVVKQILESKPHPEQGYRSCLGLLRLGQRYSDERLEAACGRAITIGAFSYKSVKSILENGLDGLPVSDLFTAAPIEHCNLRAAKYFSEQEKSSLC